MRAFPNIPPHAQVEWVVDQFITGVGQHEVSNHVLFAHPKNLEEVIAAAVEYESAHA